MAECVPIDTGTNSHLTRTVIKNFPQLFITLNEGENITLQYLSDYTCRSSHNRHGSIVATNHTNGR